MPPLRFESRLPGIVFFIMGVVMTVISAGILLSHTRLFGLKRDTAIMIGTELPALQSKVTLLAAAVEAERVFTEQALASREELASSYIFPSGSPASRVVTSIQEIFSAVSILPGNESLVPPDIIVTKTPIEEKDFKAFPGTLQLRGSFAPVSRMLGVLSYGGQMMVRDVLSTETEQAFLAAVESVSPLALSGAEDFLYLDLLEYASNPDTSEQKFLRDIPTIHLPNIRALVLEGGLAEVRIALSPVAVHLKEKRIWPLPIVRIERVTREGDSWNVDFVAFGR